MSLKRRNSRLFAIEKYIVQNTPPPAEPNDLQGIDLELLNTPELEELLGAAKVFDRFRAAHAKLTPSERAELRDYVRKNPMNPSAQDLAQEAAKATKGSTACPPVPIN